MKQRLSAFECFYVILPIAFHTAVAVLLLFYGRFLVPLGWPIFVCAGVVIFSASAGFVAYFEDRVRNAYAWSSIFLNGFLGIWVFAAIFRVRTH